MSPDAALGPRSRPRAPSASHVPTSPRKLPSEARGSMTPAPAPQSAAPPLAPPREPGPGTRRPLGGAVRRRSASDRGGLAPGVVVLRPAGASPGRAPGQHHAAPTCVRLRGRRLGLFWTNVRSCAKYLFLCKPSHVSMCRKDQCANLCGCPEKHVSGCNVCPHAKYARVSMCAARPCRCAKRV